MDASATRDTGMNKGEWLGWAAFAAVTVVCLGLSLAIQWADSNTAFILAIFIIPLLIIVLAPQMAVYGALAFALNLGLARMRVRRRLTVSFVVLPLLGIAAAVLANSGDRQTMAAQIHDDFRGAPAAAPASVALLLPGSAGEKNGDPSLCGEYCLRLLYSGEAQTVLVGTAPDAPGARFDMTALPVRAFFIDKGTSCAATGMSFGAGSDDPGVSAFSRIPETVRTRSAAGECLKSRPAHMSEADLAIVERTVADGGAHGSQMRVQRLEAYRRGAGGWTPAARQTYVDFQPLMTPMLFWVTPGLRFGLVRGAHGDGHKPLERMAFLRDAAGLTLAEPDAATPGAARAVVEQSLAGAPGDGASAVYAHVGQVGDSEVSTYLQSLAGRDATPDDLRLVQRIVADPKLAGADLRYLAMAVRHMGSPAEPLAPVFVKEMAHDDAQSQAERIHVFSDAFVALPQDVQAHYYADLAEMARDPTRYESAWRAISHLAYAPPSQALPVFVQLAQADGPQAFDSRRLGEVGLYLMGRNAMPAKDMILDRAASGKGGHALMVAIYQLGLFEPYKQMRGAISRDPIEQQNDNSAFRFFPGRMAAEIRRSRGDMDQVCAD